MTEQATNEQNDVDERFPFTFTNIGKNKVASTFVKLNWQFSASFSQ